MRKCSYWQTGSCSSNQVFNRRDISKNLRSFHKNSLPITVTNKIIQNVKNTEFNLINTVSGNNLLLTSRTDPFYVVNLSYFSRVHMCTHACSCWLLNLRLKEKSPNQILKTWFNPLNPELNPICYLLALLAHHFLHVSRIRVKSLTRRLLMSYIYGAPILDVSRSHTTTQHSR